MERGGRKGGESVVCGWFSMALHQRGGNRDAGGQENVWLFCSRAVVVAKQGLEYSGLVGVSKMLQMNKKLQRLALDDNGVDLAGLKVESFFFKFWIVW